MSHFSAGLVMTGSDGSVHVRIWGERYYICPEELGMLLFVGDHVPLLKKGPVPEGIPLVSGMAYLNPSGRAVIIAVGKIRYMLPVTGSSRSHSARMYPASSLRFLPMYRNRK